MSLNDGLGEVLAKDQVLLDVTNETWLGTLTAVKHANGRDWWVWVTEHGKHKCFYFLLSPEGVQGPFEATMEPAIDLYSLGKIIFSPDGKKMGRYEVEHGLYIYDFDRCSATLSNPVFVPLPNTSLGGGLAFSPDSRFAYIAASNSHILQFDLWASDIAASLDTVAVYDGYQSPVWTTFFLMQNGPDGRIYINCTNVTDVLHYIDKPNKKGDACQVVQHGLQLPFRNRYTLPHYPNYRLGPLDGSPCDTLGLDNHPIAKYRYAQDTTDHLQITFTDLSYYEPAEWLWDFGDGSTSQDTSPVYTYQDGGVYEVCLTVSNVNGSSAYCRSLELATVSATGPVRTMDVAVFPNPCREGTNVVLQDYLPRRASIVLYDATGRIALRQRVFAGTNPIGLSQVPPGLYFYEIREEGRLLGGGKLVRVNH